MSARPHVYNLNTAANVNESAINTETVVATLAGVASEFPNQLVLLTGSVQVTPGTTATAMTVRVRRGSLTGAIVPNAIPAAGDVAPSKLSSIPFDCTDSPGGEFVQTYVLTVQGTGEGTVAAVASSQITALVA